MFFLKQKKKHAPSFMARDFWKYIGPGLLVTVGFIDPGNWATNVLAGADYGYALLWVVALGTLFLIVLQHNAAHLGIVTGLCLSEATKAHFRPFTSKFVLWSAMLAAVSTALAELLGGAVALSMLFRLPIKVGALVILAVVLWLLFTNAYQKIEKWIIGFVSIIGLSFILEIFLVKVDWQQALMGMVTPRLPEGSILVMMSVLGAVVMPHNLYLHSEVIQSRQWQLENEEVIERQLKYEFFDTLFSMIVGFIINSAMILLAAATFFEKQMKISELSEAQALLVPLVGQWGALIFAFALLCAGISSAVTAGMAGGSIFAGMYKEPYDIHDSHTKWGVGLTLICATAVIFLLNQPFSGIVLSQTFLSVQLPITIFSLITLTSSQKVMGKYQNSLLNRGVLWAIGLTVVVFNLILFVQTVFS